MRLLWLVILVFGSLLAMPGLPKDPVQAAMRIGHDSSPLRMEGEIESDSNATAGQMNTFFVHMRGGPGMRPPFRVKIDMNTVGGALSPRSVTWLDDKWKIDYPIPPRVSGSQIVLYVIPNDKNATIISRTVTVR